MTVLKNIRQVYFLGIGGIGMSALARWFKHAGMEVSGYDRTETSLTKELVSEGITVHYNDLPNLLESQLKKQNTLVVLTPAIPEDLGELVFLKQNGYLIKKRSEVLGIICSQYNTCAVAGTHGKTTVSTMLAHILKTSKIDCTAFLGGISKNYQSNLLLSETSNWSVAEADEFDRSFLQLSPDLAVITSIDADHLDIYGDYSSVIGSFNDFMAQIKPGGAIVSKKGIPLDNNRNLKIAHYSYSLSDKADFFAANLILVDQSYEFDLVHPKGMIKGLRLNYPGLMNVENTVAASSLALLAGVEEGELRKAVSTYKGVKRRFDVRFKGEKYMLIDDYAHHPKELKATIESVKAMFEGQWVTGIFQPHLYSRTKDFAKEFAEELEKVDEIVLLDIYPAREKPIPGVNSNLIFDQIDNINKQLVSKKNLLEVAGSLKPGIILMMGAGDIDTLVEPVSEILKLKEHV